MGISFPSIIDTLLSSSKTLSHLLHTCTLPYAILTHPISFSLLILLIPLSTSYSPTPYFPSIPDLMGILSSRNFIHYYYPPPSTSSSKYQLLSLYGFKHYDYFFSFFSFRVSSLRIHNTSFFCFFVSSLRCFCFHIFDQSVNSSMLYH